MAGRECCRGGSPCFAHGRSQADTFVEYPVGEALELLELQQKNVKNLISELQISKGRFPFCFVGSHGPVIDYFKDQRNTSQVNIARIHNFGVEQRKKGLLK